MSTTTPTTTFPPPAATNNPFSHSLADLGLGYSIAIALGFLVLVSSLILSSYLCCRRNHNHNHHHPPPPSSSIILPRIIFVAEDDTDENDSNNPNNHGGLTGLHQSVINSYPKFPYTTVGKHNGVGAVVGDEDEDLEVVCSICLCEYKQDEMLRMMPDCRHCFHVFCLDAWLRLNGSCPVCRNSPLPTPLSTPLAEVVPLSQYGDNRRRS
ncbi:hypothetical protein Droror1_Dr00014222 [Drosera rotundifolia]